jgi:hypothetical protein
MVRRRDICSEMAPEGILTSIYLLARNYADARFVLTNVVESELVARST